MNSNKKITALKLPRPLINQILAHAQKNPDEEICGLISSKNQAAHRYYPVANVAENRKRHFEMSGPQQITVMKTMREHGEELMAIVHSHPDAPAIPSELDKESNNYPDVYYLVVSLDTKGVLQLRCYIQNNGGFESAELTLEQSSTNH